MPAWLAGALLLLLPLLAYWPVLRGQFLWDDDAWTTRLLDLFQSRGGLLELWTNLTSMQQYYPLSGSSFWLDYHLWGLWPLPYHVENILLHGLAALLFWRLLLRLELPGAWVAGAVLALHPVMVESVGWITERKNVLSLVLALGALLCYGRFVSFWKAGPQDGSAKGNARGRWGWYGAALLLFGAALCSKSTVVCLPPGLLLLGWWKRRRLALRADLVPLLPLFACAVGMGLITAWVEKYSIGAQGPEWELSFLQRCLVAGRVFWFYLGKLLWPSQLCFVYPRWAPDAHIWWQWLFPAAALGFFGGAWLWGRRLGWGLFIGLLLYAGSLFPVLGFLNPYFARHSYVSDHWVYLSSLAVFAPVVAWLWRRLERVAGRWGRLCVAVALLAVLGSLTWRQCAMYRSNQVLWETTLRLNPRAWLAWSALGSDYLARNEVSQARACFERSLEITSWDEVSWNNLGFIALQQGDYERAIALFEKSLRAYPTYGEAFMNLARAYSRSDRLEQAVDYYQRALALQPRYAPAWNEMGEMYRNHGEVQEANRCYEKALEVMPDYPPALNNVGISHLQRGEIEQAIGYFQRALERRPAYAEAANNLAVAFSAQGRLTEAARYWRAALQASPEYVPALKNLAWVLATAPRPEDRSGAEALTLARKANAMASGRSAAILQVLAAAYAESGQFEAAAAAARQALNQADAAALAEELQTQVRLYEGHQPLRSSFGRN